MLKKSKLMLAFMPVVFIMASVVFTGCNSADSTKDAKKDSMPPVVKMDTPVMKMPAVKDTTMDTMIKKVGKPIVTP